MIPKAPYYESYVDSIIVFGNKQDFDGSKFKQLNFTTGPLKYGSLYYFCVQTLVVDDLEDLKQFPIVHPMNYERYVLYNM